MCGRSVCLCQRRVLAVALRARRENNGRSTVAESAGRNTPERGERARSGREKRAGRAPREKQKKRKTSKVSGVTGPMSIYILTMPTVLTHWDVVGGMSSSQRKTSRVKTPSPRPWATGAGPCRPTPHRRSSRRTQWRGRPQDLPQTRPRTVQPADPRSQRYESCRRGGLPIMYAAFRLGMLWSRRPRWPDQP